MLLLAVVAIGCWCMITGRTSVAAWQVPLEYGVKGADADAQATLAFIKAASEGECVPFLVKNFTHLGAPYYAGMSDIPIVEEFQYWLPGLLARGIGVFAAINAGVMLAQVLACICFYIAARLLGGKWCWALAGGLAFGFAPFALARSIHHFQVANYWYIPFCLVIATWITRNELGEMRGRRFLFALGASCFIGMQNPYYTNMFLQLVLLGAFYQYFRQGWQPVRQAASLVAAAAFGFFLMNLDTFWYHLTHGGNSGAMVREYKWLELSALKFVDLLVPPPDHPLLGGIGQAYYGKMVAFPGEVPPSCYLGLLGIAALVWLTVIAVRRLVAQPGRNLPLEAWQVMWILAYAAVGGLNCIAGLFGVVLFRSSTRYCIFILPIVLLFAIKRLSQKKLETEIGVILAGLCAVVALWDQTPPAATENSIAELARVVDSDRQFTRQMEARLPKGAMIFQIPIMEFPESPSTLPAYDHFRPYLHSEHLRYSFGGVKGRPWLEWQKKVGQRSLPEFIHGLENYGFAGLYLNRAGFPNRAEPIVSALKQLGYTNVLESPLGDLCFIALHPADRPELPAGKVE